MDLDKYEPEEGCNGRKPLETAIGEFECDRRICSVVGVACWFTCVEPGMTLLYGYWL